MKVLTGGSIVYEQAHVNYAPETIAITHAEDFA
jgi:hypothetical protein